MAIVQVDTTMEITANKIPGISLLNKFLFEENGIRARREFIVGPFSFLLYSKLEVVEEKSWIESPKGVGSTLQKYWFS